jgi:hypothetical protein
LQEAEIGRLLLTITVAVRNAMDQNPSRAEYFPSKSAFWPKNQPSTRSAIRRENHIYSVGLLRASVEFLDGTGSNLNCRSANHAIFAFVLGTDLISSPLRA